MRRAIFWGLVLVACGGDESGAHGASGSGGEGGPSSGASGAGAGSAADGGKAGGSSGGSGDGGVDPGRSIGTGGGGGSSTDGSSGGGGSTSSGGSGGVSTGGTAGQDAGGPDGGGASPADDPCDATCHFVREGATGTADGTSWADAWTELPPSLERGHRYYVADGTYPSYRFDDAAAGQELIRVIKATDRRHGSDAGYESGYGDGVATFGTLEVSAPYVEIDGTAGLGFRAVGDFQGSVVGIGGDHVTLSHVEVDGAFGTDSGGTHDAGACTGVDIGGSFVRIDSSEIHDVADDGVSASGIEELDFVGNTVHALHACGTDGGCGPCYNGHSDGIELYDVVRSRFVENFVHDVRSTSTVFFGNWADSLGNGPSEYCEDLVFANNLFYAPEVGLVFYVQDVRGVELVHNVFWGLRQGSYGGLSIGPNTTGLRLYNNIILSINTAHTGGAYDAAEDDSDYNLFGASTGQWTEGAHSIVAADPGFSGISGANGPAVANPTPDDFRISSTSPAVNAGTADSSFPTTDFFGDARDAMPDMGAIEAR